MESKRSEITRAIGASKYFLPPYLYEVLLDSFIAYDREVVERLETLDKRIEKLEIKETK